MPGINLIIDKRKPLTNADFAAAEETTLINERFNVEPLLSKNEVRLSISKYDEYPFELFENSGEGGKNIFGR